MKAKKVIDTLSHFQNHGPKCLCKPNNWILSTPFYNRGMSVDIFQSKPQKTYWKPVFHLPSRHRGLQFDASANLEEPDYAFEMASSAIRFGVGVTREVGDDLLELGIKKVALFTDKRVAKLKCMTNVCESLERNGIKFDIFDKVRVEPRQTKPLLFFMRIRFYSIFGYMNLILSQ